MEIIKYKEYSKTLPIARAVYLEIKGLPKSHREYAESFNVIGRINRVLIRGNSPAKSKEPKDLRQALNYKAIEALEKQKGKK